MRTFLSLLLLILASACNSMQPDEKMDQEWALLEIILDEKGPAEALAYWRGLARVVDEGRTVESSLLMLNEYTSRDLGKRTAREIDWSSFAEAAADYFGERPSQFQSYMLTGLWNAAGHESMATAAFEAACKGEKGVCHQEFLSYLGGRLEDVVSYGAITKMDYLLVAYIMDEQVPADWTKLELITAAAVFNAELGRKKRDQFVADGLSSVDAVAAFCRGIELEANVVGEQDYLASDYRDCKSLESH